MGSEPTVFISYSHDDQSHKDWVRQLAADLRAAGVDAILDQWDLKPGQDAARFMEEGVANCDRVVVVCSDQYVEKANAGEGGVGYEKMIVTKQLVEDQSTSKFIPILRNSTGRELPTFLGYRIFLDFNHDPGYVSTLDSLLREIHGVPANPKPPLGENPYVSEVESSRVPETVQTDEHNDIAQHADAESKPSNAPTNTIEEEQERLRELLKQTGTPIALHEFLIPRAGSAYDIVFASTLVRPGSELNEASFRRHIETYEHETEALSYLFAIGGYWAEHPQMRVFVEALNRLLSIPVPEGAYVEAWLQVFRYPALRLFYAGGIAAVAANRFDNFRQLAMDTVGKLRPHDRSVVPAIRAFFDDAAFAQTYWHWLPGRERHYFPVSDFLEESLTPALSDFLPDPDRFRLALDNFEFLISLVYTAQNGSDDSHFGFWAPLGTYVWRRLDLFDQTTQAVKKDASAWPPLAANLFDSETQVLESVEKLRHFVGRVRSQKGIH